MIKNRIIPNIINNYTFFACLTLFIILGLILLIKFKSLSKSKKIILSLIWFIVILILSVFLYLFVGWGKNMPEYIKRGLTLLSANDVRIDKIDFSDNVIIVEGKAINRLECEEITYEKEGDKLCIMVFSNRMETKDGKFKYKLEGNFDNIKYVYLRSIEGGFGGLEDKLVYTR